MNYQILTILVASGLAAQADILTPVQRFFGLGGQSPEYANEVAGTQVSALDQAPYSPADSDLGVQEILVERASREPLIVETNRSILRTDTAPSKNQDDSSSWVSVSSLSASWRPHLAQGWFADLGLGYDLVRYDRTNAIDFENLNTRLGVFRVIPDLDDTVFFARFEYQRITTNSLFEGDYNAQRVRAGLQKVLWSAPRHQVVGGVSAAYEWSARPELLKRDEFSAELAYRYAISDCLNTVLSGKASRFDFDQRGREDWSYSFAAQLVWQISESFSANASLHFDKNDSNGLAAWVSVSSGHSDHAWKIAIP